MSIPYILFYSNGCNYSTEVINVIKRHVIAPHINYFCIDGIMSLPEYLRYTPTMRVIKEQDRYVISGSDIYTWLNSISPLVKPIQDIQISQQQQPAQQPPQQPAQQPQQQQPPRRRPEPELEQESYQTTGDTSNDLDSVFSVQNTDTAESELDSMFKNTPVNTQMNVDDGNFVSRMEDIENSRKELDEILKKK
jgi:hypothetical protein